METPLIKEIEQDARRGLRVEVNHVLFRNYKWQPYLEIQIMIESVRQLPLRITAFDLFLSYNQQEVGPLPALSRPYDLTESGEGLEIRLRKDLYSTFAEELNNPQRDEDYFQIRGFVLFESPRHLGFIEYPVDLSYTILHPKNVRQA